MSVAFSKKQSWFEATARARVENLLDAKSFREISPPENSNPSPHLANLDIPGAFDDGLVIGRGSLGSQKTLIAAQEGRFLGGAVGEIHGAKFVGLLKLALKENPSAVILCIDSGGVRLHEANAGLIGISEIMRAVLQVRAAGIPVFGLIGGSCGAFGGMGIVSCLCTALIISEEGRLAPSGPEVIETVAGVEEFDSKDRALVWRVTGGKHRFLMNDCVALADDDVSSFRNCTLSILKSVKEQKPSLSQLKLQQERLQKRTQLFKGLRDGLQVWAQMKISEPEKIPLLGTEEMNKIKSGIGLL